MRFVLHFFGFSVALLLGVNMPGEEKLSIWIFYGKIEILYTKTKEKCKKYI